MIKTKFEVCPLCLNRETLFFTKDKHRNYHHCKICDIVFVPPLFFLDKKSEKAKYDNHNNSPQHKGYRLFLNRLLTPLNSHLKPKSFGLDFGSGPGPTLSIMLEELGHKMDIYDYFYHDDKSVFKNRYDFITTTEVFEHLHKPANEIKNLWNILKPGGYLGIMTAFRPNKKVFNEWYYKRDLTHVLFFSKKSFLYIEKILNATIIYISDGVIILKK